MAIGQLYQQQKRNTAQMHLLTGVDGQLSYKFRLDLSHQIGDATYAFLSTLVELVFHTHRGDDGGVEFPFRRHAPCLCTFVVGGQIVTTKLFVVTHTLNMYQ